MPGDIATSTQCFFVMIVLLTQDTHQQQCDAQDQDDLLQQPEQQQQCQQLSSVQSSHPALFHIIGFVPVLNEYPSELITDGVMRSEVIRYTVQQFNRQHRRNVIGYTIYDTCSPHEYDRSITTEAVINVVLNNPNKIHVHSHNESQQQDNDVCLCVDNNRNAPLRHTLGIVGPALSTKSKLVNKLLSYTRLPMISYSATSPELSDEEKYPHFFRTILSDTYQAKAVEDLLRHLKWTYISILNSDDTYGRGGAHELSTAMHLCIHHRESLQFHDGRLNDTVIDGVMERLKSNSKSNAIIIWGHFNLAQAILKKAAEHGVHNKTWILSEASRRHPWFVSCDNKLNGSIINVVVNGGQYKKFEKYFFKQTYETTRNPWVKTFFRKAAARNNTTIELVKDTPLSEYQDNFELKDAGYVRNAVVAYLQGFERYTRDEAGCSISDPSCIPPPIHQHKHFSRTYIQPSHFKGLLNETISFSNLTGDALNGRYDLYEPIRSQKQFKLIAYWTSEHGLKATEDIALSSVYNKKSQCSDICEPGTYPDYTEIVKKCCWECVMCGIDYIKPNRSNDNCTHCPPEHGSNKEHTRCIPFSTGYIGYRTTESYAIYAISVIGMTITLATIMLVFAARNTRIVRTMNLYPTLIQLFIHLLLFLLPYLFLEDNNEEKCIARSFGFGILFSLIVGITLAKVTHITNLFMFKRRIRRKDLIQLNTIQIAIIVVSLAVSVFLQVILMKVNPILILRAHEDGSSAITNDCHITVHLAVQLIYVLLLQIVCCVQAFRARKLPAAFNETKYIAFAMFTSTVVMLLTIPLHESNDKARGKNIVICIAILVANFILLLMLYSYKVYVICAHVRELGFSEGRKISIAPVDRKMQSPPVANTKM